MRAARSTGLALLGAPSAAGAYGPGQDRTPQRLRESGLAAGLEAVAARFRDLGDTSPTPFADDDQRPDAQNVAAVCATATEVADRLEATLAEGWAAVVVGGDCTVEVGVVAAAVAAGASVALAYIDLDADLTTPSTADEGRLDWMGVAHLLAVDGCVDELADVGPRRPLLAPESVRLLGTANITSSERALIDELGLVVESADAVRLDLDAVVDRCRAWASGFDLLLVHLDVDVLDFEALPLAQNTRTGTGGLQPDQVAELVAGLCGIPVCRALTVCEANLDHAHDEAQAQAWLTQLIDRGVRAG